MGGNFNETMLTWWFPLCNVLTCDLDTLVPVPRGRRPGSLVWVLLPRVMYKDKSKVMFSLEREGGNTVQLHKSAAGT